MKQVKLRGNRRVVASRMMLVMSTAQKYRKPVISQHRKIIPQLWHIPVVQSIASPLLGKRNYRDKAWLRLNRLGMAL